VGWVTGGTLSLVSAEATDGSAQITGSGIVFKPAANFVGTATIDYVVTNSAGGTDGCLISVLVTNEPTLTDPLLTIAHVGSQAVVWWDPTITGWTLQTNLTWPRRLGAITSAPFSTTASLMRRRRATCFFRLEQ